MRGNNGMTLVELLIALAILCISLGAVRTAVTAYSARELTAACRELQSDLRFAQRQAIAENRKYQVFFPMAENGYRVLCHENELGVTSVIKEKVFDNGIILMGTTGVNSSVTYTARGTTGDACTITLENRDYSVDLTVNLGSGRIAQKKLTRLGGGS